MFADKSKSKIKRSVKQMSQNTYNAKEVSKAVYDNYADKNTAKNKMYHIYEESKKRGNTGISCEKYGAEIIGDGITIPQIIESMKQCFSADSKILDVLITLELNRLETTNEGDN
jgi:hypothetical protein